MSDTAPPCTIVVFGAAGDLTQRLLMPSLYHLDAAGLLDPRSTVIGADHNARDAQSWRKEIGDALHRYAAQSGSEAAGTIDERRWSALAERLDYVQLDFTAAADYAKLAERIDAASNAMFYLAVAPRFFGPIATELSRAGLLAQRDGVFRRLLIEKPFGRDVASARRLNTELTSLADETQLYRIDHFLGKEAVAGIPVLRFANRTFGALFDRSAIASVQITAAETVGVEERGSFYETTGALRDMIPNHLLSLLTLVAMEAPSSYTDEAVRDAKAELLRALRPLDAGDAVRGQYGAGTVDGAPARAYRDEDNVAADSRTETYAALRVRIDNDRWRGVPFYLRTGKRLSAHVTTIALTLRPPGGPFETSATQPHLVVLGIDPQRGVVERLAVKRPGVDLALGRAPAGFRYDQVFDEPPNVGYESLLYDALRGRSLNFQRADMIEHEWRAVQGVLDAWEAGGEPECYPAGGAGPSAADALLAEHGDRWLAIATLDDLGADVSG